MSAMETDFSLLRRFSEQGDHAAFAEIVRRYAGVVYAACQRVLRDPIRAEDVSQETFFRLMRKPEMVSQSLGAWLHAAATNLAVDAIRSEGARRRREQEYADDLSRERAAAMPKSEARTWSELSPHVDEALAELPEDMRGLLVEHFLRGRAQNELAAEEGTSAATMSRRIRMAVEALQRKLHARGVSLSALALIGFMHDHAMHAVPQALMVELGKMTLVSGVREMEGSLAAGQPSLLWTAAALLGISMAGGAIFAFLADRTPPPPGTSAQALVSPAFDP